jgi:hypothetical protein
MIFNAEPFKNRTDTSPPTLAIFLELDIKIKNKKVKLNYDYFGIADLTDKGNNFADMVEKFANGESVGKEIQVIEFKPCKNDLAVRIGADNRAQLSYVAIRLDPKRVKGLSFAQQNGVFVPFAAQTGMSPKYLSDAVPVGEDCLAAYFIADGIALERDGVYAEFSINIDTTDKQGRVITLIVDPEIGYPGGPGAP